MFIENMIESRRAQEGRKKWLTVPISFSIHLFAVALLIITSYWYFTEAVQPPPLPMVIVIDHIPLPPSIGFAEKPKAPEAARPEPKKPEKIVQPKQIPENLPPQENVTVNDSGGGNGAGKGEGGGDPDGVPGGDPNGVPGGIDGGQLPDFIGKSSQEDKGEIVDWTPDMVKPVQIKRVEPIYPPILIKARIEGMVIIRALIGTNGDVESAEVLRGAHKMLDQAALEAVLQWKYTPLTLNGHPVKVYFTVTVTFSID